MRHDPVASPQDGTPTKQVSDKTRLRNRCGSLWARMHRQDNETPALNALKALRGAPISMGRGEIPVRLAATSRLFCFKGKCKAAEPADKCLPVCSTAFG